MRPARNTECGETVTKHPVTRKEWSTQARPCLHEESGVTEHNEPGDSRSHRCRDGLLCRRLRTTARQRTEVSKSAQGGKEWELKLRRQGLSSPGHLRGQEGKGTPKALSGAWVCVQKYQERAAA